MLRALCALSVSAAGLLAVSAGDWTRRGLGRAICADVGDSVAFVAAEGGDVGALGLGDGEIGTFSCAE